MDQIVSKKDEMKSLNAELDYLKELASIEKKLKSTSSKALTHDHDYLESLSFMTTTKAFISNTTNLWITAHAFLYDLVQNSVYKLN
jgi:hypothetical protein